MKYYKVTYYINTFMNCAVYDTFTAINIVPYTLAEHNFRKFIQILFLSIFFLLFT